MKNLIIAMLFLLSVCVSGGLAQQQSDIRKSPLEDGWNGLLPLKATKAEVDKILGTPKTDINLYYIYTTPNEIVLVNYSTAPCTDNPLERGKYNVPQETVLDYIVLAKMNVVPIQDLKFRREKFVRKTKNLPEAFAAYVNAEEGIEIGVWLEKGAEYVADLRFKPSQKSIETFKCKK